MNFVNLVKLVGSREQRSQREYFKENAANAPVIHLMVIVPIGEQTLGWPVPPRGDVLSEWGLGVDSSARAEIGQFDNVSRNEDILWLDVSVVNSVSVHMVD